jgi:hypothetical protein
MAAGMLKDGSAKLSVMWNIPKINCNAGEIALSGTV